MSLEGFLVRGDAARVLFVVPDGGQVVLGLLRFRILEESDDGDVVVLDEVGDLSPK
jgi:hypothetical protein